MMIYILGMHPIESYLCEQRYKYRINLTFYDIDKIIEQAIDIAKLRYPV